VTKKGCNDIDKYNSMHDHHGGDADERKKGYVDLVNSYYNLSTDFYEIGWGQSFHFAIRFQSMLGRGAGRERRPCTRASRPCALSRSG
jgi:hypothetical protein